MSGVDFQLYFLCFCLNSGCTLADYSTSILNVTGSSLVSLILPVDIVRNLDGKTTFVELN